MIGTTYFAWLGTIYLMILTWKDHKNKMRVDDRHNWFMLGIAISLYSHFNYAMWFLFIILGISIGLRLLMMKFKPFGEADINSLFWIFIGLTILGIVKLIFFWMMFIIITLAYMGLKKILNIYKEPTPFYVAILIPFILTCIFQGLYLH